MNSLSLPVVHPEFQKLKRSGRFLHLAAAFFILLHAVAHFFSHHANYFYLGCLLLIAVDIIILVFAGANILKALPKVNLFFRLVEFFFFFGIGITMLAEGGYIIGLVHLILSAACFYLFYCEKKLLTDEYIAIHHTGITIPDLPEQKFFIWSNINEIEAQYDSITVQTSGNKSYHFELQKNLEFEELDQIHEFCRHYLGINRR
ncbi:hypothetical protein HHL16_22725 [Pseudoflavitalea sp. G-6-1-2]|uniref:hypothetical protein n=1 Tax=Pseudoflavitalea sp. G-6-1-2 TaxID=2728841 RepID=UPI00146F68C0|nr:hypothetical protein [Pseudoflavitalea sp. G-6-1-2]NML23713.1 hypothetical protein [Pseudoflavitalea sp. G-6-1-2]